MPKITFEKEVTEAQYEIFQMVLKLEEKTADQLIWNGLVYGIGASFEDIEYSPLYKKSGFYEMHYGPDCEEKEEKKE